MWILNLFAERKSKANKKTLTKVLGTFLKDGADILAKPVSALCNLSISRGAFLNACIVAKLKPIFKTGKKTDPSMYRPIFPVQIISKSFK